MSASAVTVMALLGTQTHQQQTHISTQDRIQFLALKWLMWALSVICINIVTQLMSCILLLDPLSAEKTFHWGLRKDHRALVYLLTTRICYSPECRRDHAVPLLKKVDISGSKSGTTVDVLALILLYQVSRVHNVYNKIWMADFRAMLLFSLCTVPF